jgi:hypothetical protein
MDLPVFYSKSKRYINQMALTGIPVALGTPGLGGINPLQNRMSTLFTQGGLQMSKAALVGLTLFPSTGYVGVNLFAVKQTISGSLKALAYVAGLILSFYTHKYMSNIPAQVVKWFLLLAPPWYVYDILQVIDTYFNGFHNPIGEVEPVKETRGQWILTLSLIGLIMGTLSASVATSLLNSPLTKMLFPQAIISQYISIGSYGGSSALILMGLMGIFFSEDTPQAAERGAIPLGGQAALAGAPLAGAPLAGAQGALGAPLAGAQVAQGTQVAQGAPLAGALAAQNVINRAYQAGGGISLPPLSSFLKYKRSTNIHESTTFLCLLGIIFVGGVLLSTLRAKDNP